MANETLPTQTLKYPDKHKIYIIVITVHLSSIVVTAARTPVQATDLVTFAALVVCGLVYIETFRRHAVAGQAPDMLFACWVPTALLLPPLFALLMPILLHMYLQWRVQHTQVFIGTLTTSMLSLAGMTSSVIFHIAISALPQTSSTWTRENTPAIAALGCAILFTIIHAVAISVTMGNATPKRRWYTKESLLVGVGEVCVGILLTFVMPISRCLLILALPPVILHSQVQAAARTDIKMGVLNAAAWNREADARLARAQYLAEPVAILFIDVDHFKEVNDTYGHLIGDRVLRGVVASVHSQLRKYDLLGRFGGDEFVVLLIADATEAGLVAERVRRQVQRLAISTQYGVINRTISIGVALFRIHGWHLVELLHSADMALYHAKGTGRNRVCLAKQDTVGGPIPRAEVFHGDYVRSSLQHNQLLN